jgi:flagellar hook assembly protein FlgD
VAVGDGVASARLELAAPAPTPVRDGARFTFALPAEGPVRLQLFDLMGRAVRTLADGTLPAGRWVRGWDGRDEFGRIAPPGVYLARLESAAGSATRRFIVLH